MRPLLPKYQKLSSEQISRLPVVRVRRITGYLVGDLNRWNGGKLAELEARTKHTLQEETESAVA